MDENQDNQSKLRLLEAVKKTCGDLQTKPIPIYSYTNLATVKPFLELQTQLDSVLSTDPTLSNLSESLSNLKNQLDTLQKSQGYGLFSFVRRQIANYEISKVAAAIQAEVQSWVDQETVRNLSRVLQGSEDDEEEKLKALVQFETRLSEGFDGELQEMILRAKIYPILESILCKSKCSRRVCEEAARAIVGLVRFNKDVFVGQVLMGPTILTLVSIASCDSIQVLSTLIKLIKSPLAYEIETKGYIPRIVSLLSSEDLSIQVAAMECVLELAYFARKEGIEAMLEEGLIKKLVELQRSEFCGDSAEMGEFDCDGGESSSNISTGVVETELEMKMGTEEKRSLMEDWPFTSCVTRFVASLEMGEGLDQGEKRQLKQEVLRRVREEASVSDAEATSIVAEVLWGSSPLLR